MPEGRPRSSSRGALTNRSGRFETLSREPDADLPADDDLPPLRTQVSVERARSIITRNRSPDVPFDRSINPYRGCEHGCVYCFARPTHAYLGLSPGLDFETRLIAKPNAAELLARELSKAGYKPAAIAIGTNTDPYQQIERQHRIMRGVLEVLSEFRHPVTILTKSALIERDIDILGEMAASRLTAVGVTVTTLDKRLAQSMEPRAASPARRLRAIEALARAGCPVRVSIGPVIPGLNDHEMEALLTAVRDAGAVAASYIMLRLPLEVRDLFVEWLEEHWPDRAGKVMSHVRGMRGGQDYDAQWHKRMRGEGPVADLIALRFAAATRRLKLDGAPPPLRTDLFRVPPRAGDQLSLF